ncbi:MAG TPA: hypothetical protein DCQ06_13920 [Myxococcales bacterium]|nr:hypothetical protein [Myxococcales bacterium]HAN32686.1 hypothetical protein [Myxococcales bacterium]
MPAARAATGVGKVAKFKTEIKTKTLTQVELERQLNRTQLTGLEERLLRMHHGVALGAHESIEFVRPAALESQIAIAEIEMHVWRHMQTDVECVVDNDIIDELNNL